MAPRGAAQSRGGRTFVRPGAGRQQRQRYHVALRTVGSESLSYGCGVLSDANYGERGVSERDGGGEGGRVRTGALSSGLRLAGCLTAFLSK